MVELTIKIHIFAAFFVLFSGIYLACTLGRVGHHRRLGQVHLTAVMVMAVAGLGAVFMPGFASLLAESTAVTAFGAHVSDQSTAILALTFISVVGVYSSASGARIWIRLKRSQDRIQSFALDYALTGMMCVAVAIAGYYVVIVSMRGEYWRAWEGFVPILIPLISIGFDLFTYVARPHCDAVNWRLAHSFKMIWTVAVCFSALWLRVQVYLPEVLNTNWPTFWFFGLFFGVVLGSELIRNRRTVVQP